jgi:hypothetical protein
MTRILWLALVLTLLSACGDGVTPQLTRFSFTGQAPDSPLVLLFDVDFIDGDGDLARGGLETFIDDRATSLGVISLVPIFIQNELPENATEGTLGIVLELSLSEATLPPSGTEFEMSIRVVDAANHVSNEPAVSLEITYD